MLTKNILEEKLNRNSELQKRIKTLKLASKINPDFKNPHIVGGYLRNIVLDAELKDCDVVFEGKQLNQPGILETVIEAEKQLGIEHYNGWEFENNLATGISTDLYENTIGKYSHHTDYLTLLLIDSNGKLYIGEEEKVLSDFETRIYDLRFTGVEVWFNHRRKGSSYVNCIVGDLTRGLYLCSCLNLKHSEIAGFLTQNYDCFFNQLTTEDQQMRRNYWEKKTNLDPMYQPILDRFNIKTLKTSASH